jgi:hypothetical protein
VRFLAYPETYESRALAFLSHKGFAPNQLGRYDGVFDQRDDFLEGTIERWSRSWALRCRLTSSQWVALVLVGAFRRNPGMVGTELGNDLGNASVFLLRAVAQPAPEMVWGVRGRLKADYASTDFCPTDLRVMSLRGQS